MHRFILGQGNTEYLIDIDNYKYLVGNNFDTKFRIYSIFKNHFSKINNSDFAIEQRYKRECLFDGKIINLKEWRFFEVSPYFDLDTDMKMGTKSLLLKYLDSFSDFLDYNDTMNTLSILVNSLNEEFFDVETPIQIGDKTIKLQLSNITRPTIFKEVVPVIYSDDNDCNSADLTYEEHILLQLKIIESILSKENSRYSLIYANIPHITKSIELAILGMKHENAFVIVQTNEIPKDNYQNFAICSSRFIDLSNDDMIIDRIMDVPFHISKEDFIKTTQDYFFNKTIDSKNNLIIELFS